MSFFQKIASFFSKNDVHNNIHDMIVKDPDNVEKIIESLAECPIAVSRIRQMVMANESNMALLAKEIQGAKNNLIDNEIKFGDDDFIINLHRFMGTRQGNQVDELAATYGEKEAVELAKFGAILEGFPSEWDGDSSDIDDDAFDDIDDLDDILAEIDNTDEVFDESDDIEDLNDDSTTELRGSKSIQSEELDDAIIEFHRSIHSRIGNKVDELIEVCSDKEIAFNLVKSGTLADGCPKEWVLNS